MKAYEEARADPNISKPCAHVEKQGFAGWYRCCVFKWKKKREEEKWPLVCKCAPRLAKVHKELPNVLRKLLGKGPKFTVRTAKHCVDDVTCMLPKEFEDVVAESIASCLEGVCAHMIHRPYLLFVLRER